MDHATVQIIRGNRGELGDRSPLAGPDFLAGAWRRGRAACAAIGPAVLLCSRAFLTMLAASATLLSAGAAHGAEQIYPATTNAAADIDAALQQAAGSRKRVLIDFGGNWCGDCIVLDRVFHEPQNALLLQQRFVVVHVNVGERGIDHNLDIGERYGVPLGKGVPALAVLDSSGRVVYSQKNGEFESMRRMDPKSVNDFLVRWSQ
jgi:thiol:disulfide interchange protein